MSNFESLEHHKVLIEGQVATVFLARAPVNAQDRDARLELISIFDQLGLNDDVVSIVLTGEGKCFSAGADLKERPVINARPGGYAEHNRLVRASFDVIMECPKPVIAAVNGAAIGAGCVLASVCDIIVVSENAFFSMTEVDFGMAGGVKHVLRHFSPSDARLLIYTARRISGPELLRMNVASQCVVAEDLLPTAQEIASEIAGKHFEAILAAKRSFQFTEEMTLRNGYRYEQTQTVSLSKLRETQENFGAFNDRET